MSPHATTLLVCAVIITALCAALMVLFARSQRVHRGYGTWVAAQVMGAAGLGLQLFREPHPDVTPIAVLLLLQWPITMLVGLRHFNARKHRASGKILDTAVIVSAYGLWLLSWLADMSLLWRTTAFTGACAVVHAYAFVASGPFCRVRSSLGQRTLRFALSAMATWHALHLVGRVLPDLISGRPATEAMLLTSAGASALFALVTLFVTLLLTYERVGQDLENSQQQLRRLADMDMLTAVPNRRHFTELAIQRLKESEPAPACVLMLDIDHFKRINDQGGHRAGDDALRMVARCIRETLRTGDVMGRQGGDEFAVLLTDTPPADALPIAHRVVARLRERCAENGAPPLSLSFGVVQMLTDETLEHALHRADLALYEAKRQGRSRAVVTTLNDDRAPVLVESEHLGLYPA